MDNLTYNQRYYLAHKSEWKEKTSKYRNTNPEKVRSCKAKWYRRLKDDPIRHAKFKRQCSNNRLVRKFGITIEQFNEMYKIQNGVCKLCGKKKKLVIDHCHKTNVIRGLLCRACNGFLGMPGDDESAIKKLEIYLGTKNA